MKLYDDSLLGFDLYPPSDRTPTALGFVSPLARPPAIQLGPKRRINIHQPPFDIKNDPNLHHCTEFFTSTMSNLHAAMLRKSQEHGLQDWEELLATKPDVVVMVIQTTIAGTATKARKISKELKRKCLKAFALMAFCEFNISMDVWGHYYTDWQETIDHPDCRGT